MNALNLLNKQTFRKFDVFGPTVGFLTSPISEDAAYCVMQGSIPPHVPVPLHSHPDDESFYILSGTVHAMIQFTEDYEWSEMYAGDFVHIPGNVKHAWWNKSDEPVEGLIITTGRLGKFFEEIGRPISQKQSLQPPSSEDFEHFRDTAEKYNHWLASPEENAAVGISLAF